MKARLILDDADYWARLGQVMQYNKDNGIDNSIYAGVVSARINNKSWFRSLLEPCRDFIRRF